MYDTPPTIVLELIQQSQWLKALEKCLLWLEKYPSSSEANHLTGFLYAHVGNIQQAIAYIKKAIQLDPKQAIYHSNLSNAYKTIGNINQALQHLHEALRLDPNYAEAHNNLGSLYYTQGRTDNAINYFQKAIRLNPNSWEAHYNLANCFVKTNCPEQAIEHYQTVLDLKPDHSLAKQNLAMTYCSEKDYINALPLLEETALQNNNHAEIQAQLAEVYLDLGKTQLAITQFKKAILLDPNKAELHHNLAILYLRDNQKNKALAHFEKTLEYQPNNNTAKHMATALSNEQTQENAPIDYISELFDQYAPYYNKHVKENLNYKVPELLRQALSKFLNPSSSSQTVLDLGCGTGLCGVYFRDLAKFFVGVDVSMHMLLMAKQLDAYDALCQYNIHQGIPGYDQEIFNLIIAADVLVYCGSLNNIFTTCFKALKQSGKFIFTIENLDLDLDLDLNNYTLQTTGRYAHSTKYIKKLSKQNNFNIIYQENISLRKDQGETIGGVLFILEKNI